MVASTAAVELVFSWKILPRRKDGRLLAVDEVLRVVHMSRYELPSRIKVVKEATEITEQIDDFLTYYHYVL